LQNLELATFIHVFENKSPMLTKYSKNSNIVFIIIFIVLIFKFKITAL